MADAFNGVVFRDDALIVTLCCRKIYGLQPKLVVTVSPLAAVQPALKLEAA
jgi:Holliday junction resolvase RusA-like endonuclease